MVIEIQRMVLEIQGRYRGFLEIQGIVLEIQGIVLEIQERVLKNWGQDFWVWLCVQVLENSP